MNAALSWLCDDSNGLTDSNSMLAEKKKKINNNKLESDVDITKM